MQRFWDKVEKTDHCWEWIACKDEKGYGMFHYQGMPRRAHRLSWSFLNGDIPSIFNDGKSEICHSCDNRGCVNPDHLFLGNHLINMQDMFKKKRNKSANGVKTHCKNGHEFTKENTKEWRGKRLCKACRRKNSSNFRERLLNAS
jgi:hypothetical protein